MYGHLAKEFVLYAKVIGESGKGCKGRDVKEEIFLLWDSEDNLSCQALHMLFLQPGTHFLLPFSCLVPSPPIGC